MTANFAFTPDATYTGYIQWNGTETTATWFNMAVREHVTPFLSVIAKARIALTRVRRPPVHTTVLTPLQADVVCHAPHRVVVPRGIVSWIRAGTRRPL